MKASLIIPSKLAERVLLNAGVEVGTRAMTRSILDLPLTRTDHGRLRYPLKTMEIGQHFFVPARDGSVVKTQNSVSSSVCHAQHTTGRSFHQRRYTGGIRVWRTK
jgi:hypothetical protein